MNPKNLIHPILQFSKFESIEQKRQPWWDFNLQYSYASNAAKIQTFKYNTMSDLVIVTTVFN